MDHGINESEFRRSGSYGQASRANSSLRRRSLSLDDSVDIDSEVVSEAGDIGDRALHCNRDSDSGSLRFSIDHALENGVTFPIPENNLLQSYGSWSRDPTTLNTVSTVTPVPEGTEKLLPPSLEYISCLLHLAVFGILGVLTRYFLQKLFGPSVTGVTSDHTALYLDLPSNVVGSFLMGWWGVVFKADLSRVSKYLAIGLTTGYLGSLTTFSGWNQKMLDLIVDGQWASALVGFFIGLLIVAYSIILGVETAKGFKWLLRRLSAGWSKEIPDVSNNWRVDSYERQLTAMLVLMLLLGVLLSVSGVLSKKEFNSGSSEAQLWLSCIVGLPGVWIRWFLARLNGRGLGKSGFLKWVPFGTLLANVSASGISAALATVKKLVDSKTINTVAGAIQFGFLGCLSTVSAFIAEFNAMRESEHPWRAYAYAVITIAISFLLGILVYSIPVWIEGYK